jgi:hypothetical protein
MILSAGKARRAFLKKSTKKLLLPVGVVGGNAHSNQSFFASFFSKKEVLATP